MPARVLFVDDDHNLLASFRRAFAGAYEVRTALGAGQALEEVSAHGPFAVVVSDIKMPGMDGIALLSLLREACPETVRMVLTGYADLENAIKAVNEGAVFRLLVKPVQVQDLATALEAGVEQYQLLRAREELAVLRKLSQAMEGVILGFSSLVEARDPYTAGHQRRVMRLAVAAAHRMRLDEDTITGLRMAAMVHDIGKVYVPADILNRAKELSGDELGLVRMHPTIGHDILSSVEFARPVARIVLQHHERLDGSGYPGGLTDEVILPEARILAVADVLDAMGSHRPYRPAHDIESALREVERGAGVLYDASAVEACAAIVRGGLASVFPSEAGPA